MTYQLPGTTRIVWANVLFERDGLALLHVPQLDTKGSHSIVVALENGERPFEIIGGHKFDMNTNDMEEIGIKFRALAGRDWDLKVRRILDDDDL